MSPLNVRRRAAAPVLILSLVGSVAGMPSAHAETPVDSRSRTAGADAAEIEAALAQTNQALSQLAQSFTFSGVRKASSLLVSPVRSSGGTGTGK